MGKVEALGSTPMSRLARNEARIVPYLRANGEMTFPDGKSQWRDDIELTSEQRTTILRRFRNTHDIPAGGSKEDLPLIDGVDDWANH